MKHHDLSVSVLGKPGQFPSSSGASLLGRKAPSPPPVDGHLPALSEADLEARKEKFVERVKEFSRKGCEASEVVSWVTDSEKFERWQVHYVYASLSFAIDRAEYQRPAVVGLLNALREAHLMDPVHIRDGFALLVSHIEDLRLDVPAIESITGHLLALAIGHDLTSLKELPAILAPLFPHVPVARKCVRATLKSLANTNHGDTRVLCHVLDSSVNLAPLVVDDPDAADADERVQAVMHEQGLWCVGVPPSPKFEAGLRAALARGDSSETLLQWAEGEVPKEELDLSTGLAHSTLLVLLEHCRDTNNCEYSRSIQDSRPLLARVANRQAQQVALVFALQRFCFNNKWPEGVLASVLQELHSRNVVTEAAFEAWRAAKGALWGKQEALGRIGAFQAFLKSAKEDED